MRLGIHDWRTSRDRKVGLRQNHIDNVTVSQSAIIMVFGDKFGPNGEALVSRIVYQCTQQREILNMNFDTQMMFLSTCAVNLDCVFRFSPADTVRGTGTTSTWPTAP
jgi:hypothetical protein